MFRIQIPSISILYKFPEAAFLHQILVRQSLHACQLVIVMNVKKYLVEHFNPVIIMCNDYLGTRILVEKLNAIWCFPIIAQTLSNKTRLITSKG